MHGKRNSSAGVLMRLAWYIEIQMLNDVTVESNNLCHSMSKKMLFKTTFMPFY